MKLYLAMENPCLLARRLALQGDEVVSSHRKAELIITDKVIARADAKGLPPIVGGDMGFPRSAVEAFGFEQGTERGTEQFSVSTWHDAFAGIGEQLIFSLPLVGLMNFGLSEPLVSGVASRYVNDSPLGKAFLSSSLQETLKEMRYTGFVSLLFDAEARVVSVRLGIPWRGLWSVLEGAPGKVSDFLSDPSHNRLMESWTVGLLVSRFPWPSKTRSDRIWLREISPDFEKHFSFFSLLGEHKALYTDETLLGIATSWASSLGEANRRALFTTQNLHLAKLQYRTDLSRSISEAWHRLQDLEVVGQAEHSDVASPAM